MDRRNFLKTFSFLILAQALPVSGVASATEAPVAPVNGSTRNDSAKIRQTLSDNDIMLPKGDWPAFQTTLARFSRIQSTVGYGNFCILGFDQSLRIAKSYKKVGALRSMKSNL